MKDVEYRPPTFKGRIAKAWDPKGWKPEYEKMVAMHCLGKSGGQIAKEFGYTESRVSIILNCPEAQRIKSQAIENIRATSLKLAETTLGEIGTQALNNMKEILSNEKLLSDSPFALFDRSLSFTKMVKDLRDPGESGTVNNNITNNTVIIDNLDKIKEGLKVAEEARRLHSGITGESIN